ncbi:MAG: hypothetical protein JNL67_15400 [Planctomycetaceae bacterium]|nr:hypothetical protein [Planctomycetaceae bacterium]
MIGHSLLVSLWLLFLGGTLLGLNIREAIELRDQKRVAESPKASELENVPPVQPPTLEPEASTNESAKPHATLESDPAANPPQQVETLREANRIPRVRVAALAMPLGVGVLLFLGAVVAGFSKSEQAVLVTATLAGVSGLLMLLLGLEHFGSLLNWQTDALARSALVLVASGLACVSLPGRWWLTQKNDYSNSDL